MKLTAQLRAEVNAIHARFEDLDNEVRTNATVMLTTFRITSELVNDDAIRRLIIGELNPYKIRLENILCETDIKEQGH